ncbi:universal stress protein [Glycomyces sp. TRM65418]|uniref:universal stress protein n=1 Tax=Glycomyces sp. TRM65418 TaxID=2867006 RepID=UPI001CE61F88|nr:universal stress protein [Glycomyces sp. TRM65418]MCC3761763.1 universal stress protein [Glycomyces sp. TRM65418]QZD55847.1 universal stress protein [Glycomyces sp. TRM65418]
MPALEVLLIIIALWAASGLVALLWMARQGHRDRGWILLAVLLGPIFAASAPERARMNSRLVESERDRDDSSAQRRALVGIDGSPASERALDTALDLLPGDRYSLILARVVDFDLAEAADVDSEDAEAIQRVEEELARRAARISDRQVSSAVLAGPPAGALLRYAEERDVDVIVVGRHGKGLSKALMGDVSQTMIQQAPVPVLVAGGAGEPRR